MQKPSNNWNLEQWLHYIENRNTQEIQLGLSRIKKVAAKLDLLKPDCKVITVTGTNGKGSSVAALEQIYHTAGYQVGTYTSPHLIHFNERIRVNCQPISDNAICTAFGIIEQAREEVVLTYFEMATLAALLHFQQLKLNVIILEVGIGGRLDATNIIDPDLALITTVDYDHQDYLGSTLDAIAFEKSGILRQAQPYIYADSNPPDSLLKAAKRLNSPAYLYGLDYFVHEGHEGSDLSTQNAIQTSLWELRCFGQSIQLPKPRIQLKSAAAAIIACKVLDEYLPVSAQQIADAMKSIFIPGRLQLCRGQVDVLYDVSHNAQSARLLSETIRKLNKKSKIHAVFSALRDKDIFALITPLKDCVYRWYPAQLDNKRASNEDFLLSHFRNAEISVDICYDNPLSAFEAALNQAAKGDLIIVYGSFYTVGQVMAAQQNYLDLKEST